MSTVVASFLVLLLAVAAMAVGVVFGRAPIRGSCGGPGGGVCAACTGRCRRRASDEDAARREEDRC